MPVRLLTSSVLKWPDRDQVHAAAVSWARSMAKIWPEIARVGYIGSYAKGNWGVGSDIDLVIVVDHIDSDFNERARDFDATELPVPADALVYSKSEWEQRQGALSTKPVWVFTRG